ncbi:RIP metalloprotease RseP [Orientia chuto str. Dubai]|uniref:RIP metalloprotease RseP n=1 Tax=Orientia chuto str. Dubai TaxID=1359168 RepID=A0A0F3MLK2_9RICK|nr:M50 family metallopeptidase [Candidatus Orientia mediorientalis]KJV56347.1 RIP metalloprotease RseP [Orientia chuto str. Dubai]
MFLVTTILSFIITTNFLIFVHEFGHYFCARWCGVYVQEFSIGLGKELFSFLDKNLTRWKVCILPLGGFVRMQQHSQNSKDKKNYNNQPIINKILIVLAGPAANFIFALAALTFLGSTYGKYTISSIVDRVIPGSAAHKAGIYEGDLITEVAGVKVYNFLDTMLIAFNYPDVPINVILERDNQLIEKNIVPQTKLYKLNGGEIKIGDLGIRGKLVHIRGTLLNSMLESVSYTVKLSKLIFITLWQKLTGQNSAAEVVGIVGIAYESSKAISRGGSNFLYFLVNLSISLGLMNLLPIPPLDGGRLLYLMYEIIAGRRSINLTVYNITMQLGTAIIIFLIVISVSNDIKNLLFKF